MWTRRQLDHFTRVAGDKTKLVGSYLFNYEQCAMNIRSGKVHGARCVDTTGMKKDMLRGPRRHLIM